MSQLSVCPETLDQSNSRINGVGRGVVLAHRPDGPRAFKVIVFRGLNTPDPYTVWTIYQDRAGEGPWYATGGTYTNHLDRAWRKWTGEEI